MDLGFETDGHLKPGRTQVSFEDAEAFLVEAPCFAGSATRRSLWEGLERYLVRFWQLDADFAPLLDGRTLVDRLWMGGSYVSSRLDPHNIDITVFVDDEAAKALRGRPGAGWLTDAFARDRVKADFGLSPLEVRYRRVVSPFRRQEVTRTDEAYLAGRGAWDDWWQRRRASDQVKDGPTLDTVRTVRGYLEVTL